MVSLSNHEAGLVRLAVVLRQAQDEGEARTYG
jgi:hypothetical protein